MFLFSFSRPHHQEYRLDQKYPPSLSLCSLPSQGIVIEDTITGSSPQHQIISMDLAVIPTKNIHAFFLFVLRGYKLIPITSDHKLTSNHYCQHRMSKTSKCFPQLDLVCASQKSFALAAFRKHQNVSQSFALAAQAKNLLLLFILLFPFSLKALLIGDRGSSPLMMYIE